MALNDAEIEAVAARVVELLRPPPTSHELVDANEIARRFGVSRAFVYDHADDLGAVRLGPGPRARLRFDPTEVGQQLGKRDERKPRTVPPPARRSRTNRNLLPIHRSGAP